MAASSIRPAYSFCIPQYNRTSFLLRELESLSCQTFRDFEVCISDDCSTDGRSGEIVTFLESSGLRFKFKQTEGNLRYDGNLRRAIGLAEGRYCFLMGNDDMLAEAQALERLHEHLQRYHWPEVVITNYRELSTGLTIRRMPVTGLAGSGPSAAANHFRSFGFVSGVLLDREQAWKHATDKWDEIAMYQMYLGARILAEGGRLLGVSDVVVLKDIQIPGQQAESHLARPVVKSCPIIERPMNLAPIGRLVFDAVEPYASLSARERLARRIFGQLLVYTYPPWLFAYRKAQSWRYALGICLAMRPRRLLANLSFTWTTRLYLQLLHTGASLAGLFVPVAAFAAAKPWLYRLAKRHRRSQNGR